MASNDSTSAVLRNTSFLLGAQLLAMPLSIVVNAVVARGLGASQYGLYFQAATFAGFAYLFVEWGQPTLLTGLVATQRERAGVLLGSGLAFRVSAALIAIFLLPVIALLAGYGKGFVAVLALCLLGGLFGTIAGACQDVFRGYERTDFAAASFIGWQLLSAAVVVPVLLSGGNLYELLFAQVGCAGFGAAFVLWMTPRMQIPRLAVSRGVVVELWRRGHPFLLFSAVLALQSTIDTAFLSKLGSAEEMGWFAVARKLTGVLISPAAALIGALYPTLCRLRKDNTEAFRRTATDALQLAAVVAVPAALGCFLFPELGVGIFGRKDYGPAEDNLRILAAWLLLAYFSMPIGSCLTALGRQRGWTLVLFAGVVTGAVLDPFMIRWFQANSGNGGTGVCLAALLGEIVTLTGAVCLLPRGLLAGVSLPRLLSTLVAGAAMVIVAVLTARVNSWMSAISALLAYALCLQLTGGANFLQLYAFVLGLRRQGRG